MKGTRIPPGVCSVDRLCETLERSKKKRFASKGAIEKRLLLFGCLLADLIVHLRKRKLVSSPGTVSDIMAGCEPSWRHLAQFGLPLDAASACDGAAWSIGAADWPIELARRFTYLGSRLDPDIGIGRGHRRH